MRVIPKIKQPERVEDLLAFHRSIWDSKAGDPDTQREWALGLLATHAAVAHTEARNRDWWMDRAYLAESRLEEAEAVIPKLKQHATWFTVWLIQFLKIIDGAVGFISLGFVPLDLSGSVATRAFMRMVARAEKKNANRRSRRKAPRKRKRTAGHKRPARRDDPPRTPA